MTEFTVKITALPLGVHFSHFDDSRQLFVSDLKRSSIGADLGLLCGDVLVSVNNKSVLDMESNQILDIFRSQTLPFLATFERFDENYQSDADDNGDINAPFGMVNEINTNHIDYDEDSDMELEDYNTNQQKHRLSINTDNSTLPQLAKMYDLLKYSPIDTPVDISIPKCQEDDFVHIDHNDMVDIDKCTVNLVNGFIRCNVSQIRTDEKDKNTALNLIAQYLCNNVVMFDKQKEIKLAKISEQTTVCTSSNGFIYGEHEWSIKVVQTNNSLQEIGVISNNNLDEIMVKEGGVTETNDFGAKAIYGNEMILGRNYYTSCNENGHVRVNKELVNSYWKSGDVIKVNLNLKKNSITFYLNDQKVRKVISLEANKMYYPFIAFCDNCRYELIDYQ